MGDNLCIGKVNVLYCSIESAEKTHYTCVRLVDSYASDGVIAAVECATECSDCGEVVILTVLRLEVDVVHQSNGLAFVGVASFDCIGEVDQVIGCFDFCD